MNRLISPVARSTLPIDRSSSIGMASLAAAALLLLTGCSGLQPLPTDARLAAHGSWLTLQGMRSAEVSAGVQVELPDAPFRARFADGEGIYYQASQPVVYRTIHQIATAVQGGLFMRFEEPTVAVVWIEPLWGAATMPHSVEFSVRRFTPALNGSAP
ncbi:MAG: hypothetical protein U1E12_04950 [Hydrogenophaga sp.]|uniref:hypothetical protein n=1 Tax=Hydrogenophaga sp. TaxID=1904254 RepID=UPI002ABAEC8E|nr:hypothetical protein [Hydrogenophaga sp.]MDZ4101008.1 hypothetical protein [Hydrogenophaga sp.]MDZ4239500.1 hypothetical protein [Hydrogenophaga sp.]